MAWSGGKSRTSAAPATGRRPTPPRRRSIARIGSADGGLTQLGTCLGSAVSTVISRSAISLSPVRWWVAGGKGPDSHSSTMSSPR